MAFELARLRELRYATLFFAMPLIFSPPIRWLLIASEICLPQMPIRCCAPCFDCLFSPLPRALLYAIRYATVIDIFRDGLRFIIYAALMVRHAYAAGEAPPVLRYAI